MLLHLLTALEGKLRLLPVTMAAYQQAAIPPGEVTCCRGEVRAAAAEVAEGQRRVCQRVAVFARGEEAGSPYSAINRVGVFL